MNGGLLQGTKLGPLLFAVLVNNLLKNWHGRIKFVDDTTAFEIIPRGILPTWPEMTDIINILIRCEFAYHVEFGFICDY